MSATAAVATPSTMPPPEVMRVVTVNANASVWKSTARAKAGDVRMGVGHPGDDRAPSEVHAARARAAQRLCTGGIGGCPYAPGASGNVVTEDLVFMLHAMGCHTGVDFEGLMRAREVLQQALPNEPLYGMVPEAGLPKGFDWIKR